LKNEPNWRVQIRRGINAAMRATPFDAMSRQQWWDARGVSRAVVPHMTEVTLLPTLIMTLITTS
jgi:hypothetical protein